MKLVNQQSGIVLEVNDVDDLSANMRLAGWRLENWCAHCRAPFVSMDPTQRVCSTGRVDCSEVCHAG